MGQIPMKNTIQTSDKPLLVRASQSKVYHNSGTKGVHETRI